MHALLGGVLIGISASLMLFLNGRVTGISGIISSAFSESWRILFLIGLLVGGFILFSLNPSLFENTIQKPLIIFSIAGLLVGFGTALGSGCTSGHGVCGISRLSFRSLIATLIFMASGILTVFLVNKFGGPL